MAFFRWTEGADPVRSDANWRQQEIRRSPSTRLASGTLACPECDAPVSPTGRMTPADAIGCPYCGHAGVVREFLSLAPPARPARVDVYVRIRPS